MNWICGSGGTKKIFNSKTETCIGVVSRASKLPLQLESIADFEHCIGQELQFIGVNNVGSLEGESAMVMYQNLIFLKFERFVFAGWLR